jgi:hypothetical protein
MLALFEELGVAATRARAGLLPARGREEAEAFFPVAAGAWLHVALALSHRNFFERPRIALPRQYGRPGLSQQIDQGVTRRAWPPCTSSMAMDG